MKKKNPKNKTKDYYEKICMSIYKIIKGNNTFLSTTEEGRDDKNDDCGARKKGGGVFFFHLVGGTVEGVRCCVRSARVLRKRLSALQREQKKNGGASVLVERVSGKTV